LAFVKPILELQHCNTATTLQQDRQSGNQEKIKGKDWWNEKLFVTLQS
jgi:hypothetical protein